MLVMRWYLRFEEPHFQRAKVHTADERPHELTVREQEKQTSTGLQQTLHEEPAQHRSTYLDPTLPIMLHTFSL